VLATVFFGCWGGWRYEREHHPTEPLDRLSIFYHACQLLIAHGVHLEGELPWELHVGRALGLVSVFMLGFLAFSRFFREEIQLFQLRWRRNHVVICGLGDLGLRLALDGRRCGKFVVAIEKQGRSAPIEHARRGGILVIEGDASDPASMHGVNVARAEFVVACCESDETNVAISANVGDILTPDVQRRSPLVCRLLLRSPKLRQRAQDLFGPDSRTAARERDNFRVDHRDLHLEAAAARQCLRLFPLDFEPMREGDPTIVRLVIVGFGEMGRNLAIQAARIGTFANNASAHDPSDRGIRITVMDRDVSAEVQSFRRRYPGLEQVCVLECVDLVPTDDAILDAIERHRQKEVKAHDLVTYAVCLEIQSSEHGPTAADSANLDIGMALSNKFANSRSQILIYQEKRAGFGALFPKEDSAGRLHAFGMIEDIYNWDILLHESDDRLARAIHENYVEKEEKRRGKGHKERSWTELADNLKESNRAAADHIPIKLRALGYTDLPIPIPWYKRIFARAPANLRTTSAAIEQFNDDQIRLLAQMEHRRWCSERWLDGWKYSSKETDRKKKISKDLILPLDKVPAEDREKDFEQIRAIPHILRSVGRLIWAKK
jgi:hypothetical protein